MVGREGMHRAVLLRLLADAGAANGASHLATGNVTFDAPSREANAIARRFEAGIADVLGRHEPVIIRRLDWLAAFVATEPFSSYDEKEWELLVAFLPLGAKPLDANAVGQPEGTVIVAVRDRELLGARPRVGRWPHVNKLAERATGLKTTSRAWSTLVRLVRA